MRESDGDRLPVEIRLAVALRMFAGASSLDLSFLYCIAKEAAVCAIMWEVADAISNTPTAGSFLSPQMRKECARQAKVWALGVRVRLRLM